jgi:hypothetical protein
VEQGGTDVWDRRNTGANLRKPHREGAIDQLTLKSTQKRGVDAYDITTDTVSPREEKVPVDDEQGHTDRCGESDGLPQGERMVGLIAEGHLDLEANLADFSKVKKKH